MIISPSDYLRVRVASQALELARERRLRLAAEAARLEDAATRAFADALAAAGVDPAKVWRFDDATMALEEVATSAATT